MFQNLISTRLLALQCRCDGNKWNLDINYTVYYCTSSKSSRWKCSIFLATAGTKIPHRIHKNTPFQVKKIIFPSSSGVGCPHLLPPTKPSGSDLRHCLPQRARIQKHMEMNRYSCNVPACYNNRHVSTYFIFYSYTIQITLCVARTTKKYPSFENYWNKWQTQQLAINTDKCKVSIALRNVNARLLWTPHCLTHVYGTLFDRRGVSRTLFSYKNLASMARKSEMREFYATYM